MAEVAQVHKHWALHLPGSKTGPIGEGGVEPATGAPCLPSCPHSGAHGSGPINERLRSKDLFGLGTVGTDGNGDIGSAGGVGGVGGVGGTDCCVAVALRYYCSCVAEVLQ